MTEIYKSKTNTIKIILFIILMLLIISGISILYFSNSSSAVVAVNVEETLDLIGDNNPLYIMVEEEVNKIQMEKAILEARKFEEEESRRIEEEINKKEELIKKAQEKKIEEEIAKNQKIAYLTFDDGPSDKVTSDILDILDEYEIKGTFFVLGKMAANNPDLLKRIYDEGHSIGHHSYSHNYNYIYSNTDNFLEEINRTEKVFKEIIGENFETNLLRLPGGSFEKYKHKYVVAASEAGFISYDWNALNGDAESLQPTKEQLINRLKSTIKDRKEVIILMHDSDTKRATVDALPEIIEYLKDKDYVFKPLE